MSDKIINYSRRSFPDKDDPPRYRSGNNYLGTSPLNSNKWNDRSELMVDWPDDYLSIQNELRTTNKFIDWFDEAISRKQIEYYEYNGFSNIQEICSGGFGKVYRANWRNTYRYFALKSFFSFDNATVKEIVHEVIII